MARLAKPAVARASLCSVRDASFDWQVQACDAGRDGKFSWWG